MGFKRTQRLTLPERKKIQMMIDMDQSVMSIAQATGRYPHSLRYEIKRAIEHFGFYDAQKMQELADNTYRLLTNKEKEQIRHYLLTGLRIVDIAHMMDRKYGTIHAEVKRNGGKKNYSPVFV